MKQKNFSKGRILWGTIFIAALIICLICGYKIISYLLSDGGDTDQYLETTTTNFSSPELAENHNINWIKLKEDNRDIALEEAKKRGVEMTLVAKVPTWNIWLYEADENLMKSAGE